jgi:hypothetical protein
LTIQNLRGRDSFSRVILYDGSPFFEHHEHGRFHALQQRAFSSSHLQNDCKKIPPTNGAPVRGDGGVDSLDYLSLPAGKGAGPADYFFSHGRSTLWAE